MKKALGFVMLGLITPILANAAETASLEKTLASLEQMRQSSEEGSPGAQLEMGILYEFGYHMPKNNVTALAWYLRAAEQGNALAATRRDQLKAHMKPEEIEAAQKLASEMAAKKPQTAKNPPAIPAAEPIPAVKAAPVIPAVEPAPVAEVPPTIEQKPEEKAAPLVVEPVVEPLPAPSAEMPAVPDAKPAVAAPAAVPADAPAKEVPSASPVDKH